MIGKVIDFDGYNGKIATTDDIYYFIRQDINDGEEIKNDDLVRFQSNNNPEYKFAYYINKIIDSTVTKIKED